MGLDMSLYREVQLKGKMEITDKKLNELLGDDSARPSVRHEVCYWRKFNALHNYFNNNFNEQDNDNCVDMYMSIDDIIALRDKLEVLRKKIKLGEGWVMNGGSADTKKVGEEIELLDGKKKVEDLEQGDIIKIEKGDFCKSGRAIVSYVSKWSDEVRYHYNYQEPGKVVLNYKVCEEELPTECGFFFGSTDYDEYYVADIDSAIEQLSKVVEDHNKIVDSGVEAYDIDYYYRAWY